MDMPRGEDSFSVLEEIGDHNEQGAALLAIEVMLILFCLGAYVLL